ncbi:MAG: aconitase X [Burkholderiaceae bacterium]
MKLDEAQQAMQRGVHGAALQWAIGQQIEVGRFFGARRLIPVGSVLAGAEIGITGAAGLARLEALADDGARVRVPSFTAACSLDFDRWAEFGLPLAQYAGERKLHDVLRRMGFIDTSTCVNYQSISPPRFREHLGWGDTGAVAFANSAAGARSNYEGGPASIAAALTGLVPEYGFHLPENRRAGELFELTVPLRGTSDWSALGAWLGAELANYWSVPAVLLYDAAPSVDELKHCLAAAASFGSLAMMHLIGATPEAGTVEAAFVDRPLPAPRQIGRAELDGVYRGFHGETGKVDLVVFSAPQLSLPEAVSVVERLDGRRVAAGTRLIITVNHQVQAELQRLGHADRLVEAGGELLAGTCFYVMAPALVRQHFGFHRLVTPSCKLVNILGGAGYRPALRSVEACIDAAVSGVLR